MRIPEKTLIPPALYIIYRDGPTSTSSLIAELEALFQPTGEDAAILAGRSDTKFSQKVRNLKSHRESNGMKVYTDLTADGDYTLTPEGEAYVIDNLAQLSYLFSNRFQTPEVVEMADAIDKTAGSAQALFVFSEEEMISEGKATVKESPTRERSKKLRDAAIRHYRKADGKLYCDVCDFCFEERYGAIGRDFIEIHHVKPICQYAGGDFDSLLSEAVEKVRPLCSNCHSMIHRNPKRPLTIPELKAMLL